MRCDTCSAVSTTPAFIKTGEGGGCQREEPGNTVPFGHDKRVPNPNGFGAVKLWHRNRGRRRQTWKPRGVQRMTTCYRDSTHHKHQDRQKPTDCFHSNYFFPSRLSPDNGRLFLA